MNNPTGAAVQIREKNKTSAPKKRMDYPSEIKDEKNDISIKFTELEQKIFQTLCDARDQYKV
jgi:hypothetical protein